MENLLQTRESAHVSIFHKRCQKAVKTTTNQKENYVTKHFKTVVRLSKGNLVLVPI